MEAGYLSAKAYRALKTKSIIGNLRYDECVNFDPEIRAEIERLFDNDAVIEDLYYLEKLEQDIKYSYPSLLKLLDEALCNTSSKNIEFVNKVGKKQFLFDYIFCSLASISNRNFVQHDNIKGVKTLRRQIRLKYIESFVSVENCQINIEENSLEKKSKVPVRSYSDAISIIEDLDNKEKVVSESFEMAEIVSGQGFALYDRFDIDEKFLNSINPEDRKYVLFLYGLDKSAFIPFEIKFKSVLISLSVRIQSAIKHIGYRQFYVRYLFSGMEKLLNIRNFGRKSAIEINEVRPDLISFVKEKYSSFDTNEIESFISEYHQREQEEEQNKKVLLREIIGDNKYFLLWRELDAVKKCLSVRAQNAIQAYKGDFIEDFVHQGKDVKTIRNIGKKTEIEFRYLIDVLKAFIGEMPKEDIPDEVLAKSDRDEKYKDCCDDFCEKYLVEEGHLPMFYILEQYLKKNKDRRPLYILNMYAPIFKDSKSYTLEEIAAKCNLTRERVRQIYVKCCKILKTIDPDDLEKTTLNYSKILSQKDDWRYIVNRLESYDFIDISKIEDVVYGEECFLTNEFIMYILPVIDDDFAILGESPLPISSRNKKEWSNSYLIRKRYIEAFDFYEMIHLVHEYEDNNTESMTLSVEELLSVTFFSAWKDYDYQLVEPLQNIVSQILISELDMIPDMDYRFTLVGKMQEATADVIYDILKREGVPMDIANLFLQFEKRCPDRYKSSNSLRVYAHRDPRICLVGVNDQIALSEWDHVHTGSIRGIIVSFLAEHKEPQHIEDIMSYISKIRETNKHSIYSTMSSGNQFVKLGGGYFGLADRSYSDWLGCSELERDARRLILVLEKFLLENQRFPFCQSSDGEEEELYQWWNHAKKNKKNFTNAFWTEIERIENTYSSLPRNKTEYLWQDHLIRYKDFVSANFRKPTEFDPIEADLAKWFSKNLNDLIEGKLSADKERAFTNLCKSL